MSFPSKICLDWKSSGGTLICICFLASWSVDSLKKMPRACIILFFFFFLMSYNAFFCSSTSSDTFRSTTTQSGRSSPERTELHRNTSERRANAGTPTGHPLSKMELTFGPPKGSHVLLPSSSSSSSDFFSQSPCPFCLPFSSQSQENIDKWVTEETISEVPLRIGTSPKKETLGLNDS